MFALDLKDDLGDVGDDIDAVSRDKIDSQAVYNIFGGTNGVTNSAQAVPMVAAALQAAVGGSLPRLLRLGLCDRLDDLVTPSQPEVVVNALVRPELSPLTEVEAQALTQLTQVALEPLLRAWGGEERLRRPYAADVELVRLALGVADGTILRSCAADALLALDARAEYRQAADWGQRAIALLQAAGMVLPLPLLWCAGEACLQVGEPEPASGCYDQALTRIVAGEATGSFEYGGLLLAQGRLLAQSGEPDRALALFEQAHTLAAGQDTPKNAAVILATSPGCAPARARSTWRSSCNASGWRSIAGSVILTVRRLRCGTSRSSNCSKGKSPRLRRASLRPAASSTGSAASRASASSAACMARFWRPTDSPTRLCRSCAGPKAGFRQMQRYADADQVAEIISQIEANRT